MGVMADYILNGDDCQYCGEYLGEGNGYTRSCLSCSKNDNDNESDISETIENGLSFLRTAAIRLRESDKIKKSKKLHNMCDQIAMFAKSVQVKNS